MTALAVFLPQDLHGQDVASMVVRVQANGAPVTGVPIVAFIDGNRRLLATTAESGLAIVDLGRSRLIVGSRVLAFAIQCDGSTEVVLTPAGGSLPVATDECDRTSLGSLAWGRDERLVVALGDNPAMHVTASEHVTRQQTGFRIQIGPVVSVPGGLEPSAPNSGFGGELQFGVDGKSGLGLGAGVGFTSHGLEGADESMSHWSIFAEPRYTFNAARPGAHPYVAGRIAYTKFDPESGSGLLSETGWSFGGGGGVVFPASAALMIDLWTRIMVVNVDAEGFDRSGSDLRAGASLRF
ncbi:MAG: outer membrane beta-barrel protein [Gemmatimonadota bacterium]